MSVISASSVKCGTLADGTLRITIEVEPKDALAAFTLFSMPGTPMGIAALKDGYAKHSDPPAPAQNDAQRRKGGSLAKLAGMMCSSGDFASFIEPIYKRLIGSDSAADVLDLNAFPTAQDYNRHCIISICGIDSRADLDHDPAAAATFHRVIRLPYAARSGAHAIL